MEPEEKKTLNANIPESEVVYSNTELLVLHDPGQEKTS